MHLSDVIPSRFRINGHQQYALSRWHVGHRQLVQIISLAVVAVVMIPLAYLIIGAVSAGQEGVDYLLRARTLRIVGNSIGLTAVATLCATAIAIPFAWLTSRSDLPGRRAWLVLGLAAMVIPSYLTAVTYAEAFGPKGILQSLLEPFGVDRLPGIKGFPGAALTLTVVTFPYIVLPVRAALLHCDRSLEEAGQSLGLNRWGVFRQIILPQMRPALSTGMLMTALYCLSDFGAVAVMHFNAFTRAIFIQTESFRMDKASVLAILLVGITLVLLLIQSRLQLRGRHYRIGTGASRHLETLPLGKWKIPALIFCAGVVFIGVVIPLLVLFSWLAGHRITDPVTGAIDLAHEEYRWCERCFGAGGHLCRLSAGAAGRARRRSFQSLADSSGLRGQCPPRDRHRPGAGYVRLAAFSQLLSNLAPAHHRLRHPLLALQHRRHRKRLRANQPAL